jgi:hypothetical protein
MIDLTGLDDSAVLLEPGNWTCCACTWENKASFLVCVACCSKRAAPDDSNAVQDDEVNDKVGVQHLYFQERATATLLRDVQQ